MSTRNHIHLSEDEDDSSCNNQCVQSICTAILISIILLPIIAYFGVLYLIYRFVANHTLNGIMLPVWAYGLVLIMYLCMYIKRYEHRSWVIVAVIVNEIIQNGYCDEHTYHKDMMSMLMVLIFAIAARIDFEYRI